MKYLLICVLLLVGCAGNCKPSVITKNHYIVKELPAEYFVIPDPLPMLNVQTATQKDVSLLLVNMDSRIVDLETKLVKAKQAQDENVKAVR